MYLFVNNWVGFHIFEAFSHVLKFSELRKVAFLFLLGVCSCYQWFILRSSDTILFQKLCYVRRILKQGDYNPCLRDVPSTGHLIEECSMLGETYSQEGKALLPRELVKNFPKSDILVLRPGRWVGISQVELVKGSLCNQGERGIGLGSNHVNGHTGENFQVV